MSTLYLIDFAQVPVQTLQSQVQSDLSHFLLMSFILASFPFPALYSLFNVRSDPFGLISPPKHDSSLLIHLSSQPFRIVAIHYRLSSGPFASVCVPYVSVCVPYLPILGQFSAIPTYSRAIPIPSDLIHFYYSRSHSISHNYVSPLFRFSFLAVLLGSTLSRFKFMRHFTFPALFISIPFLFLSLPGHIFALPCRVSPHLFVIHTDPSFPLSAYFMSIPAPIVSLPNHILSMPLISFSISILTNPNLFDPISRWRKSHLLIARTNSGLFIFRIHNTLIWISIRIRDFDQETPLSRVSPLAEPPEESIMEPFIDNLRIDIRCHDIEFHLRTRIDCLRGCKRDSRPLHGVGGRSMCGLVQIWSGEV